MGFFFEKKKFYRRRNLSEKKHRITNNDNFVDVLAYKIFITGKGHARIQLCLVETADATSTKNIKETLTLRARLKILFRWKEDEIN